MLNTVPRRVHALFARFMEPIPETPVRISAEEGRDLAIYGPSNLVVFFAQNQLGILEPPRQHVPIITKCEIEHEREVLLEPAHHDVRILSVVVVSQ